MHRINSEWCQHRVNRFFEILGVVLPLLLGQLFVLKKEDIIFLKSRHQFFIPKVILVIDHFADPNRYSCKLLAWTHCIGTWRTYVAQALLLETSDSNLKKFVEIRCDNTKKF